MAFLFPLLTLFCTRIPTEQPDGLVFSFSFIEMYLRPPSASEEARINDWIKVRQSGIRYYLSLGDQRIVDRHYIIRPKAEFEVRKIDKLVRIFILLAIRNKFLLQSLLPTK